MKTKTIYIADDGTEFDNELMCIGYEAKQKGYPELVDNRYVAEIAENAFLICAALLGKKRENFINRLVSDETIEHLGALDITGAFADWIVNTAEDFERLWKDGKDICKDAYDYEDTIFKFAHKSLPECPVVKIPNLTDRENRIAQNAYWICYAMQREQTEHLDSYFCTHPMDC